MGFIRILVILFLLFIFSSCSGNAEYPCMVTYGITDAEIVPSGGFFGGPTRTKVTFDEGIIIFFFQSMVERYQ